MREISRTTFTGIVCAVCLSAQPPPHKPEPAAPQPAGQLSVPVNPVDPILQKKLAEIGERVQRIEKDSSAKSEKDSTTTMLTALIAALAVLSSAGVGLLGQYYTAKRTADLARRESVYRHTEKILEFRVKQLELFYAPMLALLGQSRGLYDKMLHQLAQDDPKRYRWNPSEACKGLQVLAKDGTWQDFRLLDQLPALQNLPKSLALAKEILRIGEAMTAIISAHAGLASEGLIGILGQYMAHYAILSAVDKQGAIDPYDPGWHKMGYFPRELDQEITKGYRELTILVGEYVEEGKRVLAAGSGAVQNRP